MDRALQAIPRPRKSVAQSSLAPAGSAGGSISARGENARKSQNCKVEMTRCTINSKNLCIFALRGTCFPSIFSISAVFLVVKGSYTDLHRFDPRRPYSIKTRIKTGEGGASNLSDPSDWFDLSPQTKASPNTDISDRPHSPRANPS